MEKKEKGSNKYSAEFKKCVILDMRKNKLGYGETVRKYWGTKSVSEDSKYRSSVRRWERIYLEEGEIGLMAERRGKKSAGRPKKLDAVVEEDLIAENQRLREQNQYLQAEIEYIKKLSALVLAEEQEKDRKQ